MPSTQRPEYKELYVIKTFLAPLSFRSRVPKYLSKQVLRAQPSNLLKFISDYLSTLLVTRENLFIAARVCDAVCDCFCRPELDEEFKKIGLDDEEAADAAEITEKFFGKGEVNEGNLLIKLVRKTSINENQLPELLAAIRRAFLTHQRNHIQVFENSADSGANETENAVRHTLGLFRKTNPSDEIYDCMARKIQTAYRAYTMKRNRESLRGNESEQQIASESENLEKSKVTFGTVDKSEESVISTDQHSDTSDSVDTELAKMEALKHLKRPRLDNISSTSLAGSHLCLPMYKPYSAHDIGNLMDLEELPEKERSNFDYTRENAVADKDIRNKHITKEKRENNDENMLFYKLATQDEDADDVIYESESVISEFVVEDDIAEEFLMEKDTYREEVIVKEDILQKDFIEGDFNEEDIEYDIEEEIKDDEVIDEDIVEDGFVEEGINKDEY